MYIWEEDFYENNYIQIKKGREIEYELKRKYRVREGEVQRKGGKVKEKWKGPSGGEVGMGREGAKWRGRVAEGMIGNTKRDGWGSES